jgi:hypothetical protein
MRRQIFAPRSDPSRQHVDEPAANRPPTETSLPLAAAPAAAQATQTAHGTRRELNTGPTTTRVRAADRRRALQRNNCGSRGARNPKRNHPIGALRNPTRPGSANDNSCLRRRARTCYEPLGGPGAEQSLAQTIRALAARQPTSLQRRHARETRREASTVVTTSVRAAWQTPTPAQTTPHLFRPV